MRSATLPSGSRRVVSAVLGSGSEPQSVPGCPVACRFLLEMKMVWTTPVVVELCLGMEVTSYASASL